MLLTRFNLRSGGIAPTDARNVIMAAANSQILYGLKHCTQDLLFQEIGDKYDIAGRRMLRASLRCE